MFHRSYRPVPRQRVSTLVQHYEEVILRSSPPSSPPRTSLDSDRPSVSRHSYILDSVPEDPSDADDYMIPHVSAASPVTEPDSPHSPLAPRNRRSLPRMNYSAPAVIVPDYDTPMPDAWDSTYDLISPTAISAYPTPIEAHLEHQRFQRLRKVKSQISLRHSRFDQAKQFLRRSTGAIRKIAGKHRIPFPRRTPTPRNGSEDTFELRTPRRKLESQPSVKSRAKRVARGAMHSLVHLPEHSVEAVAAAQEASVHAGKTIRKSASRTKLRVADKVDDAKEKVSTSLPNIRPPRSRYYPLMANPDHYVRPLIQDTHTTPGSRPWSVPMELDEPASWPSGIIPPPPSPVKPRDRNRLHKRRPDSAYTPPSTVTHGKSRASLLPATTLLPNRPPTDAIFAQANYSDVEWQAQDATHPMIIITESDNREGSWYLPLNDAGQIQLRYNSGPRTPPSRNSSLSSSVNSAESDNHTRTRKWYNGRLSFGSTRSASRAEGRLSGSHNGRLEQVLASYNDRTPLLVEFLEPEELASRSEADARGQRRAVLWAPIGSVLL